MKKNILSWFVLLIFTIFIVTSGFGVSNFSISTSSGISQNLAINSIGSGFITLYNSGNESLNLSISKIDLKNNQLSSILLNLNTSSILNFKKQTYRNMSFNYSTSNIAGTFLGSINFSSSTNSSLYKYINLSVNVSTSNNLVINSGNEIVVSSNANQIIYQTFSVTNTGNSTINDLTFSTSNLQGQTSIYQIYASSLYFTPNGFNLLKGETRNVQVQISVPSGISADNYKGLIYAKTASNEIFTQNILVNVYGSNLNVFINKNSGNVVNGVLVIQGRNGNILNNYNIYIGNNGNTNSGTLYLKLKGDLTSQFGSNTIPQSSITFSPQSLNLYNGNSNNILVSANIPQGIASGTYYGTIQLESTNGNIYSSITLQLNVIGDIYFSSLDVPKDISPNTNINVNFVLKNQGTKSYRSVSVTGVLYDINNANSNIIQSSPNVYLGVGSSVNQTLTFSIPKDAMQGSHTLDLTVNYDGNSITKVKSITINRPKFNAAIENYAVSPTVLSCNRNLYTYLTVQNLGRNDLSGVYIKTSVLGTPYYKKSNIFNLDINNQKQENQILNLSKLNAGNYKVAQIVVYNGIFNQKISQITIQKCNFIGGGVTITKNNSLNNTSKNRNISNSNNNYNLFGHSLNKNTFYLLSGLGFVVILIIISLFLV